MGGGELDQVVVEAPSEVDGTVMLHKMRDHAARMCGGLCDSVSVLCDLVELPLRHWLILRLVRARSLLTPARGIV